MIPDDKSGKRVTQAKRTKENAMGKGDNSKKNDKKNKKVKKDVKKPDAKK